MTYRRAIADGIHRVMVEVLAVPEQDRFEVISEHDADALVYVDANTGTVEKVLKD